MLKKINSIKAAFLNLLHTIKLNVTTDKKKAIQIYTQTPFQSISEAFYVLELAFRLQKAFEDGLIDKTSFTRSIELDTGTGTKINAQDFDQQASIQRFHNLVLVSMTSLFIAIDRGLDDTFGEKKFEENDNINSLRNVFYMLRCAVSHDITHPKWHVKDKYRLIDYNVIVPKDIMRLVTGNPNMTEVTFKFNFEIINKQTVLIGSFYGIDGLIPLTLYALSISKKD